MLAFPNPLVRINNKIIVIADPITAEMGTKNEDKIYLVNKEFPITIAVAAPSAAPADTPIRPGSANGFLNKPCKQAPERDNAAPTKIEKITLGNLILNSTSFSILESELFKKDSKEIL